MTVTDPRLVPALNESLALELPARLSAEELLNRLTAHITGLINHDFDKLVYYLYRIDVSESRLKSLLEQQEGKDAARLIAALIIERQLQKIKSRREHRAPGDAIDENEKW